MEGRCPPPDGYVSWDEYMVEIERAAVFAAGYLHDREHQQGMKAIRLAPTLAVYRALINSEHVPREALDPAWVRRYRL